MKIAITAVSDEGLVSKVAQHFGKAPYLILVEIEDGKPVERPGIQVKLTFKLDSLKP